MARTNTGSPRSTAIQSRGSCRRARDRRVLGGDYGPWLERHAADGAGPGAVPHGPRDASGRCIPRGGGYGRQIPLPAPSRISGRSRGGPGEPPDRSGRLYRVPVGTVGPPGVAAGFPCSIRLHRRQKVPGAASPWQHDAQVLRLVVGLPGLPRNLLRARRAAEVIGLPVRARHGRGCAGRVDSHAADGIHAAGRRGHGRFHLIQDADSPGRRGLGTPAAHPHGNGRRGVRACGASLRAPEFRVQYRRCAAARYGAPRRSPAGGSATGRAAARSP